MTKNHLSLSCLFIVAVLCLAIFQFSENTADPDLWSHVFFGAQFVQTGKPTTIDYYSWTAYGQPSFDHEYLGEAIFGLAYLVLGGPGLLLLKIIVGLLTFGIALSIAAKNLDSKTRLVAWAFGALAVVEISFGFAARPQVFTALLLAIELWLLGRIHRGQWQWAFAFPPIFALWFNLHGGSLAGAVLLFAAAAATSAQMILICLCKRVEATPRRLSGVEATPRRPSKMVETPRRLGEQLTSLAKSSDFGGEGAAAASAQFISTKFAPAKIISWLASNPPPRALAALWISAIVSAATVVLNPHGIELARWLVGSVLWLRPQIQEWNPPTLGWDHAAFFFCAAFAAAAFVLSRRRHQLWEIAVLAILFIVAFRSVRNTPLFCIAALALVPPFMADVLQRFRRYFQNFEKLFARRSAQNTFALILALVSAGIVAATFTLHKKHFWTMEVPRAQYPVAAVKFIRQYDLRGNLLVFFDWGEMCIWNLPDSRVSIDGRLDSVYPADVIAAHWNFYNAGPFDTNALNLARADFALLPSTLAGAGALAKNDRWTAVYYDNLAVVLVKNPAQFSKLAGLKLPVHGSVEATEGRDSFPNHLPPNVILRK